MSKKYHFSIFIRNFSEKSRKSVNFFFKISKNFALRKLTLGTEDWFPSGKVSCQIFFRFFLSFFSDFAADAHWVKWPYFSLICQKHQNLSPFWYLTYQIWSCFYEVRHKNFARLRQIFARNSPDFWKNGIFKNISFVNNYPYNRKNTCQIWWYLKIRKISNGYLKTEFDEFLLNFDLDLRPNPQISAKNFNLPISTNL